MTFDNEQLHDLRELAANRACHAIESVIQLVDDDEQAYTVILAAALAVAGLAASCMQHSLANKHKGDKPDINDCGFGVLKHLFELIERRAAAEKQQP